MNVSRQVVIAVLFLIVCLCVMPLQAQSMRDSLNVSTIPPNTRMDKVGWPILAGLNGGWGRFPDYYSYKRVEIDGVASLIDSYPHAQNHGSSNAILLDWDGDPANGNTELTPLPGMTLTFGVSVYMQPWANNSVKTHWIRDGAGQVNWCMGPGMVDADYKPIKDIRKQQPNYSWQDGRGPRIGYYTGAVKGYTPTKMPVIQAFSPMSEKQQVQLALDKAQQWVDLQLVIKFADDLQSATCQAQTKPTDSEQWVMVGEVWSIDLDSTAKAANNPATWNALILDLPIAIWSTKGYGKPDVSMLDRYRNFVVSLQAAGDDSKPVRCEMLRFEREALAVRMPLPARVFAGQDVTIPLEIINAGDAALEGTLLLKVGEKVNTLAADWTVGVDKQWQHQATITSTTNDENLLIDLLLKRPDGQLKTLVQSKLQVIPNRCPTESQNVIRNASFELPTMFAGSAMRQGYERFYTFAESRKMRLWADLPIEGWWAEGQSAEGVTLDTQQVYSGNQSLKITATDKPVSVISAPGCWLPAGSVTISAWVRTQGATGKLTVDLLKSDDLILSRRADQREAIGLSGDSDWQCVSLTVATQDIMQSLIRFTVEKGSVWIDDVQVQPGTQATAFELRPAEWVRMHQTSFVSDVLPMWVTGDEQTRSVELYRDSRMPLTGIVSVWLGTWDRPAMQLLGKVNASDFKSDQAVKLAFPTAILAPNAYVLTVDYHANEQTVYAGVDQFNADTRLGGRISNSMMRSRMAMCFAMIPDYEPAKIFGVGNGMLDTKGDHFGGYHIEDYHWAGQLDYVCDRGRYSPQKGYLIAAGGLPTHRMETSKLYLDASKNPDLQNPAVKRVLDLTNPKAYEQFLKQAHDIGTQNGSNPQIASYQMANERPFYARDGLCPTDAADADFRAYCKQIHGDLATLNKRWGTTYTTWDQVEQPLSASQLETVKNQEQLKGAAATAWTAVYGKMSKQVNAMMQKIPGRGLDWYHWRTANSLKMYRDFRSEAKKVDTKTLYSTNLCWPNFWPQMAMPFFRSMDVTMLDLEYSAGQKRGLGTPAEMMEIMEMFESNAPDKPLWGIEVYTQPQWPAESTALQNWGLVAHGMTNNLVFGWRPYSDHGRVIGTRAWEKDDAHPMWFIIDNDGKKLPSFDAVEQTKREIHTFHKQYDALSLRRLPTKMAIYLSDDMSEYLSYSTANKPYNSMHMHARNTLVYLMRMEGLRADVLDSELLIQKLEHYDTLILPPTPLLSDADAKRIADFTNAGGKLILAGLSGQLDPWLNKRPTLGGDAWQSLGWQAPDYRYNPIDKSLVLIGQNIGKLAGGQKIIDSQDNHLGWQKRWGKGHVYALGVYPSVYNKNPHMPSQTQTWMQDVIRLANLPRIARWEGQSPTFTPTDHGHGSGEPVVEVVLRQNPANTDRLFAFVLNQGGSGHGQVLCDMPTFSSKANVRDAITGQTLQSHVDNGQLQVMLTMNAWGYRVLAIDR